VHCGKQMHEHFKALAMGI